MELWKPIVGFELLYEISTEGQVRSLKRNGTTGGILALGNMKGGYKSVHLSKNNRQFRKLVHCLVAHTFLGEKPPNMECAHLNGNPSDNRIDNLKWVSKKENASHKRLHGTSAQGEKLSRLLKNEDVLKIRSLKNILSQEKIGMLYGVSRQTVSAIHCNTSWRHI